MAIHFTIERTGRAFYARADGAPRFFIGYQTSYADKSANQDFEGLYNVPTSALPKLLYAPSDCQAEFGFWAEFIGPTAKCEGGNYLTLNTYDRARFTFGFGQFAAHVPDGDFVGFFRDLVERPEATDYFPDLSVKDGRIVRNSGGGITPLETAASTIPLMNYLNPTLSAIEDAEVVAAAKLIHWTMNTGAVRALQGFHMIGAFKTYMHDSDSRLQLDGKAAAVCCVICDIRHQGRATYPAMQQALASENPLDALLKLGSIAYPDRVKTLKKALSAATSFSGKSWSRSAGAFV